MGAETNNHIVNTRPSLFMALLENYRNASFGFSCLGTLWGDGQCFHNLAQQDEAVLRDRLRLLDEKKLKGLEVIFGRFVRRSKQQLRSAPEHRDPAPFAIAEEFDFESFLQDRSTRAANFRKLLDIGTSNLNPDDRTARVHAAHLIGAYLLNLDAVLPHADAQITQIDEVPDFYDTESGSRIKRFSAYAIPAADFVRLLEWAVYDPQEPDGNKELKNNLARTAAPQLVRATEQETGQRLDAKGYAKLRTKLQSHFTNAASALDENALVSIQKQAIEYCDSNKYHYILSRIVGAYAMERFEQGQLEVRFRPQDQVLLETIPENLLRKDMK
ncbi:MAG: hypothetical protein GC136_03335 [Alphaproteobacteria bacterium]|nr:hypothetical protein [Alphaproteobacteria bacterium]